MYCKNGDIRVEIEPKLITQTYNTHSKLRVTNGSEKDFIYLNIHSLERLEEWVNGRCHQRN